MSEYYQKNINAPSLQQEEYSQKAHLYDRSTFQSYNASFEPPSLSQTYFQQYSQPSEHNYPSLEPEKKNNRSTHCLKIFLFVAFLLIIPAFIMSVVNTITIQGSNIMKSFSSSKYSGYAVSYANGNIVKGFGYEGVNNGTFTFVRSNPISNVSLVAISEEQIGGVGYLPSKYGGANLRFFVFDRHLSPINTYEEVTFPLNARLLQVVATNSYTGKTPNPFYAIYIEGSKIFALKASMQNKYSIEVSDPLLVYEIKDSFKPEDIKLSASALTSSTVAFALSIGPRTYCQVKICTFVEHELCLPFIPQGDYCEYPSIVAFSKRDFALLYSGSSWALHIYHYDHEDSKLETIHRATLFNVPEDSKFIQISHLSTEDEHVTFMLSWTQNDTLKANILRFNHQYKEVDFGIPVHVADRVTNQPIITNGEYIHFFTYLENKIPITIGVQPFPNTLDVERSPMRFMEHENDIPIVVAINSKDMDETNDIIFFFEKPVIQEYKEHRYYRFNINGGVNPFGIAVDRSVQFNGIADIGRYRYVRFDIGATVYAHPSGDISQHKRERSVPIGVAISTTEFHLDIKRN